jgi:hypothetical protein
LNWKTREFSGGKGMRHQWMNMKSAQDHPGGGKRVPGIHVVVMNLRGWPRGIHHYCSERFVNGYLDEFFFRFDGRNSLRSIWHQLIEQFMANPLYRYMANAA